MDTVSKSALKAKMLEYFRSVEETGAEAINLVRGACVAGTATSSIAPPRRGRLSTAPERGPLSSSR